MTFSCVKVTCLKCTLRMAGEFLAKNQLQQNKNVITMVECSRTQSYPILSLTEDLESLVYLRRDIAKLLLNVLCNPPSLSLPQSHRQCVIMGAG